MLNVAFSVADVWHVLGYVESTALVEQDVGAVCINTILSYILEM